MNYLRTEVKFIIIHESTVIMTERGDFARMGSNLNVTGAGPSQMQSSVL